MADHERPDEGLAGLTSPDEKIRIAAVRGCARAGNPAAEPQLRKLAGEDPSVEVRYQARIALNLIREALAEKGAPAHNFPFDPTASAVRSGLSASDPAARVWALREAVLHDEGPALLADVIARIRTETVPDVRAQLVTTLAEMGGTSVHEHVAAFLSDADARVRANAVEAVETLGDPRLHPLLVKALPDPDHRVKMNAITALDRAGKLNLLKCCARMIRDKDYWVRDAATYSLAAARLPAAVPILTRALSDPHEPVRGKARDGLNALADAGLTAAREALNVPPPPPGVPREGWDTGLQPLLKSTENATGADESHLPAILTRLTTETDPTLQVRLLTMLGNLGNDLVVPILLDFTKHANPEVYRAAGSSMIRLGAEHLVPTHAGPRGARPAAGTPSSPTPAPQAPLRASGATRPVPPARRRSLLVPMLIAAALAAAYLLLR